MRSRSCRCAAAFLFCGVQTGLEVVARCTRATGEWGGFSRCSDVPRRGRRGYIARRACAAVPAAGGPRLSRPHSPQSPPHPSHTHARALKPKTLENAVDRERTNGVHFKLWLEMWQRSMVVLCHKERKESKGFASFVAHTVRLPKQEAVLGLTFDNGGDA